MVLSNAERQARHRKRLKEAAEKNSAYELDLLHKQNQFLEEKLNETRKHIGLAEVQMPKSAREK